MHGSRVTWIRLVCALGWEEVLQFSAELTVRLMGMSWLYDFIYSMLSSRAMSRVQTRSTSSGQIALKAGLKAMVDDVESMDLCWMFWRALLILSLERVFIFRFSHRTLITRATGAILADQNVWKITFAPLLLQSSVRKSECSLCCRDFIPVVFAVQLLSPMLQTGYFLCALDLRRPW